MSLNKACIIGNLGSDPEVRYTDGGAAVANFTVATNEKWTDKQGQPQERTEWHKIVVWGKVAENCGKYLAKGRQVYIEGSIQTREWTDKEGNKRWTTEINARNVQFLSGGSGAGSGDSRQQSKPIQGQDDANQQRMANNFNNAFSDDDIPF